MKPNPSLQCADGSLVFLLVQIRTLAFETNRTGKEMIKILVIFLLWIECVRSKALLPSIAGKLNQVIFVYPTHVQSERDLFFCPENSACNIIHKRFWLPPMVERICKCPQRHDCTWSWSEEPDNYTMTLDNRSQIKFCEEIELPKCSVKKPALRVVFRSPKDESNATATGRHRHSAKVSRHAEAKNVTALCNCQDVHYWKLKVNSTKYEEETDRFHRAYFCSKLKKCTRSEFCGYVRTDTHSTFYRCSCPKGHLCISQDKSLFKVDELLFNGYGYKAFCLPVKN